MCFWCGGAGGGPGMQTTSSGRGGRDAFVPAAAGRWKGCHPHQAGGGGRQTRCEISHGQKRRMRAAGGLVQAGGGASRHGGGKGPNSGNLRRGGGQGEDCKIRFPPPPRPPQWASAPRREAFEVARGFVPRQRRLRPPGRSRERGGSAGAPPPAVFHLSSRWLECECAPFFRRRARKCSPLLGALRGRGRGGCLHKGGQSASQGFSPKGKRAGPSLPLSHRWGGEEEQASHSGPKSPSAHLAAGCEISHVVSRG